MAAKTTILANRIFRFVALPVLWAGCCCHFIAFPDSSDAVTWSVSPDGTRDFQIIQDAVDAASDGDTVLVFPGTYSDVKQHILAGAIRDVVVYINKNLSLIGAAGSEATTIMVPYADGFAIWAEDTSDLEIHGLELRTFFEGLVCVNGQLERVIGPVRGSGIYTIRASVYISDCLLSDSNFALKADSSTIGVVASQLKNSGIGIWCEDSDVVVERCSFVDCWSATSFIRCNATMLENDVVGVMEPCGGGFGATGSRVTFVNNDIRNVGSWGIATYSGVVTIANNRISDTNGSVHCRFADSLVVSGNIFYGGSSISIYGGDYIQVRNNTVVSGSAGVFAVGPKVLIVENNIFANQITGISLTYSQSTPMVSCNDLWMCDNLYVGDIEDLTGIDGNFSADPRFCGNAGSGNYFLQGGSPCSPGNHPDGNACGLIGVHPVNCIVDVKKATWGSIKKLINK